MHHRSIPARAGLVLAAALACAGTVHARQAPATAAAREQQVAQLMQRDADRPPQLRAFLQRMPKGGDLHNHLGGSNYAEDFLRWADQDEGCVQPSDHSLHAAPCGDGQVPARGLAARDPALYSAMVDALSMRNYTPGQPQASGHDRFFESFARFGPAMAKRRAEAIAATMEQAARDRVPYVELMADPPQVLAAGRRAQGLAWNANDFGTTLAALQQDMPAQVQAGRDEFAATDAQVRQLLRCGQADASPGCGVQYRYVLFVLRTLPPANVFGQMATAYALVAADPQRFVAVNIVAPEDNPVALADYRLHMAMFRYLSARQPQVPLTLHAGELAHGLVPPADLRFHIRDAVAVGARRIGHGVDIAYEDDANGLLAEMKRRQVAVEINLTSNDGILGIRGAAHPLPMYLEAGVPVVLSTDDEGVSRNDMTNEYQRAVQEHGVDYATLKQIARNGLSYSFAPGDSLWGSDGHTAAPACAAALAQAEPRADARCQRLLDGSAKARLQWQQALDFTAFEDTTLAGARR